MAALPAVTLTSPWKPACHEPVTAYVAEQPAPDGGVVGGVVGGLVGGVDGGVAGGGVGVLPPKIVACLLLVLRPLGPLTIRWPHVVSWLGSKPVVMSRM